MRFGPLLKSTGPLLLILAAVLVSAPANAVTPSVTSWQQAIRALPLSGVGCFTASFPSAQWHGVPCQGAPDVPFGPEGSSPPSSTVGNGVDYSAVSSGGRFGSVTGSFPSITPGSTEIAAGNPELPNTFSLQLNSSFFSGTPACAGASKPSECLGWQQFVLSTSPKSVPKLFMQYWLINYGPTCETGWKSYQGSCYKNSPATKTPALKISKLAKSSLEGSASSGGSDAAVLTIGSRAFATSNADTVLHLSSSWTTAEFGIFGDGGGSEAQFSSGTTLEVMTSTNDGTEIAPSCAQEGFTGETNNLSLVKTPKHDAGSTTAIVSRQSNVLKSSASCVTSPRAS